MKHTERRSWRRFLLNGWQRVFSQNRRNSTADHAETRLNVAQCTALREQARRCYEEGNTAQAIELLQDLTRRLETERLDDEFDPDFERALGYRELSSFFLGTKRADLVLEPATKAVKLLEASSREDARGRLAAVLNDLGKAYYDLGQLHNALRTARRSLALERALGHDREIADALLTVAASLTRQQRYEEADAHYVQAFHAAQTAQDLTLQARSLQKRGILQRKQAHHEHAIALFQEAIQCFEAAGDRQGEMRTCDLLGTAKVQCGELHSAETWYQRSRELAEKLADRHQLAIVAQNMGILYQKRAEQATEPDTQASLLRQAIASVNESLAIKLELKKQVGAEASYFQLGVLNWKLGDLEQAEKHLLQATEISEALSLPKVYQNYTVLGYVARDRGDTLAAAAWHAKCAAKVVELKQRHG